MLNGTDSTTGVTHATFNTSRRLIPLSSVGILDRAATLPPSGAESWRLRSSSSAISSFFVRLSFPLPFESLIQASARQKPPLFFHAER